VTEYYTCKDCAKAQPRSEYDQYECRNRSPLAGGRRGHPEPYMDHKPVWPIMRGDEWCAEVLKRREPK